MNSRAASSLASLAFVVMVFVPYSVQPPAAQERAALAPAVELEPTAHAPLPEDPEELWLAPKGAAGHTGRAGVLLKFAEGVRHFNEGNFTTALPLVSVPSLATTPLADYATYYTGLTQLRMDNVAAARRTLARLQDRSLDGHLQHASRIARAQAAEKAGDPNEAARLYEQVANDQPLDTEVVLYSLALARLAAGDRERAAETFRRIRYEYPLSDEAGLADAELARLTDIEPRPNTAETFDEELKRAERLFAARRYPQARAAFVAIRPFADATDREVVELRIAESDFYLRRYRAARDALRPYLSGASRAAEAQFFYLAALRELGEHDEYLARVRALVEAEPASSWSEEALNNLGTHHILDNDDAAAAEVFRELLRRFPTSHRAERAAWKLGWWEYKNGNLPEVVSVFEKAAATFPRSDYRPSWVYWAARARERIGDSSNAAARYRLITTDYLNSYYGRLATRRLERLEKAARAARVTSRPPEQGSAPAALPPTAPLIRLLLSVGLEEDALNELQFAQRRWGTSPPIDATIAWVYYRQGDLRRAINQMKRAYPQHLSAAGGARLPDELLRVIFPLEYWDSIRKYSRAHRLDPYIIAALIAQESTFDPKIRSAANAYGLMQVVPGTGRRLARSLGIRYRGISTLTNATINVRMGTLYFARLIEQFGGVHLALAAYNAGENRVVRWVAERPGLERDEFIDDIPFPETQNYVKKILGTAEDYRQLYAERQATPGQP